ncbi:MAG: penicillin acylase family protein [Rhodoferax sp.]|nr:penicillin acylase family protein [Rhodoferax sp.]
MTAFRRNFKASGVTSLAASNNRAVHKLKTRCVAGIVANDTITAMAMPSLLQHVNVKSPSFAMAGVTVPGSGGFAAGYNGYIGWGVTMVMGDNQDIYLEKLKRIDGKLHYPVPRRGATPAPSAKASFGLKAART